MPGVGELVFYAPAKPCWRQASKATTEAVLATIHRPTAWKHGQANQVGDPWMLLLFAAQADRFAAEEQDVAGLVADVRVDGAAFGGECEDTALTEGFKSCVEIPHGR